jgi:hypothetical protein
MDKSWPQDFPWNNLLQEEPPDSFILPAELLELDLEFSSFFDPLCWPDDQSTWHETGAQSMDVENNFADPSQIDQCAMQDTPIFHDPVEDPAAQSGASSPPQTVSSQRLTTPLTQQRFTDCLHEFEGVPNQPPLRRRRKNFSSARRKEVEQLRKVGACIRCRLTKSSVRFHGFQDAFTPTDESSANWTVLARRASKHVATLSLGRLSAFARECSMCDSLQVNGTLDTSSEVH